MIYELHVGTFAANGRPAGHVRRRPRAARRTCATLGVSRRPGDAAVRVRRRHLAGATTRPTCSRSSRATAGRTRSSGSSATRTRTASPSSSTSSTTTSARPTSTCGGSTAGREDDGGGIYFYNDERAHDAVGRDPPGLRPRRGPHVPARQRADLARGVPLRRPPVRLDRLHPDRRRRPGDADAARPTAGRSWPGSTTRSGPASRGRSRSPRTSRAIRRSWRRPPRAAPASAPSGTPAFVCRRAAGAPARRRRRPRHRTRSSAAIVGEGRGAPLTRVIYTESHDEVANGAGPRPRGDRARRRATTGGRRSARSSARRSCSRRPASRCCSRARSCSRTAGSTTRSRSTGQRRSSNSGILRLHRDLIALRRAPDGVDPRPARARTSRSCGPTTRRSCSRCTAGTDGGPHDDTVVVANFADRTRRRRADRVPGARPLGGPAELGLGGVRA